ncbi:FecCD family ABC transporter permease [Roseibium aggregatum]|uniref:Putative ABC transporter permease protein n=1 Tax=Roseibium aggregatum TaxID=187304 RepID=A0A0M6Y7H7_9HYPH|nr:iron ABC transporter permease [Roseibium aggregatum]CTQ46056.1 putative ABC transporter permease protein [Roseibium aggregatum]
MGKGAGSLTGKYTHFARSGLFVWLGLALVLGSFAALLIGPFPLTPSEAVGVLARVVSGAQPSGTQDTVLLSIRLPRVVAALLVGASLAAAGACYQTLFRNPLVSPDILGVSAGAGLGAVLGIFLSLPVAAIQLMGFAGGLAAVALVGFVAATVRGGDSTLVLVLAGVVVGALAGAATSLLKVLADPYDQLPAITFWLLGSLAGVKAGDILPAVPAVLFGLVPLFLLRWRINVLSLGDEEAKALGVEAGRLRLVVIFCATLITASVVAIAGVVGWVGLVIPHIARMIVGPGFGRLLPAAALLGAGYLLAVDTLARTLSGTEVPLGILTAVVGAPFFLWLLARGRRAWA